MNFIYCGSCYDHYRGKWPSLKKGFLIGAPLSLCAHLAARGLGGNAEGTEGATIVPDAQACFLPPSVAQSEGVEIWGVRRKK